MKKFVFALIIAVLGSASALATDLSVPAHPYTKAPVAPLSPAYNWSGFYIGVHGGYADDPATATFDPLKYAQVLVPSLLENGGTTAPFQLSAAPKGGFGGFQIGYNWQPVGSPLVIGVEADASFGRIRGEDAKPFFVNTNDNGDNGAVFNGLAHLRQSVDDFGTVRGRLGFAADTLLVYATGGGAWAHTKTNFSVDHIVLLDAGDLTAAQVAPLLAGGNVSSNALRYGYSVGGGAEWAFARHWSIKAEYLYLSFTGRGATLVIPGGVAHAGNFEMHTAKGGINYRF